MPVFGCFKPVNLHCKHFEDIPFLACICFDVWYTYDSVCKIHLGQFVISVWASIPPNKSGSHDIPVAEKKMFESDI